MLSQGEEPLSSKESATALELNPLIGSGTLRREEHSFSRFVVRAREAQRGGGLTPIFRHR